MAGRRGLDSLSRVLADFPAAAILGLRKVGKAMLAMTLVAAGPASTYLEREFTGLTTS